MIRINKIRNKNKHDRFFGYISSSRIILSNVGNQIFFLNYFKYAVVDPAGHSRNKIKYIEDIERWFGVIWC